MSQARGKEEGTMTPKQQTMHEICDILDADARKEGVGLDREMFTKKNMRHTHAFLTSALENMRRKRANLPTSQDERER